MTMTTIWMMIDELSQTKPAKGQKPALRNLMTMTMTTMMWK
jgi:hypothetical protein